MRIAIIDLGTNSVRFDVHEILPNRTSRRLYRERLMVKLGQNVFATKRLFPEAKHRTLEAFRAFKIIADEYKVQEIIAVGTSTLRDAKDGPQFAAQIKKLTGIKIQIISGLDEALYIARGVIKFDKTAKGRFLLFDMGGGSTEIVSGNKKRIQRLLSLNLGAARLQQNFLKTVPPLSSNDVSKDGIASLRAHIKVVLEPYRDLKRISRGARTIGSSGGIRAICRLAAKGNGSITLRELRELNMKMSRMSREQLLKLPRMESNRIELILAGSILLEEVMAFFKSDKIYATEYSLRDGILEYQRRNARILKSKSANTKSLSHVANNIAKPSHVLRDLAFCHSLCDKLSKLLKLTMRSREVMDATIILKGINQMLGETSQGIFTSGLIDSLDFGDLSKVEREFISALCQGYSGGKVNLKELSFAQNRLVAQQFLRILSILRIVHALSISAPQILKLNSIHSRARTINIRVSDLHLQLVARMRVEQAQELFERVYKKTLVLM